MRRTREQRRAYAARRMSKAVDRLIQGDAEAARWVEAWRLAAGIRKNDE